MSIEIRNIRTAHQNCLVYIRGCHIIAYNLQLWDVSSLMFLLENPLTTISSNSACVYNNFRGFMEHLADEYICGHTSPCYLYTKVYLISRRILSTELFLKRGLRSRYFA